MPTTRAQATGPRRAAGPHPQEASARCRGPAPPGRPPSLTVARSFCVRPLLCRPCWMTLPTSKVTRSWCSSSVSRSSLAVFLLIECCLFWPAAPAQGKGDEPRPRDAG